MISGYADWSRGFPVSASAQHGLMPFAAVSSGFAWMSAAAHFLVLANYDTYIADLRKGINRFRWYEYAFSSSLMIAQIAELFGMWDVIALVMIASVNACMNLFGYLFEVMNAGREPKALDWTAFYYGCFAGAVPWAAILGTIGSSPQIGNIPKFVWGVFGAYLVMFQTFPLNMYWQYKQVGRYSDAVQGGKGGGYMYGEKVYQILSLVAKSLLLWLVFFGTNQPNQFTRGNAPA
jgi:hypothetical protein